MYSLKNFIDFLNYSYPTYSLSSVGWSWRHSSKSQLQVLSPTSPLPPCLSPVQESSFSFSSRWLSTSFRKSGELLSLTTTLWARGVGGKTTWQVGKSQRRREKFSLSNKSRLEFYCTLMFRWHFGRGGEPALARDFGGNFQILQHSLRRSGWNDWSNFSPRFDPINFLSCYANQSARETAKNGFSWCFRNGSNNGPASWGKGKNILPNVVLCIDRVNMEKYEA